MGVTYKAFDTNLRCDVALKVINPQFLSSDTARHASFVKPGRQLNFGIQTLPPCFISAIPETATSTSWNTLMARPSRAASGGKALLSGTGFTDHPPVARALIAAERQKLVHRDIKPSNIMLVNEADDHLLVKVIDFVWLNRLSRRWKNQLRLRWAVSLYSPFR